MAFVVRPAGPSWDVLLMGTWCGASNGKFDVPSGRVPHGQHADTVIRRDLARYDIALGERLAVLGEEPLLETRRRTIYIYRADDGLPVSWSKRISLEVVSKPPTLKFCHPEVLRRI